MDRSNIHNPTFEEQEDDETTFITKMQFFGAQKAMRQSHDALNDRIEHLATDVRESEVRTRDYLDTKLSSQMEEIRALMVKRASCTSTSSRRRDSSRHSLEYSSGESPPRARSHH